MTAVPTNKQHTRKSNNLRDRINLPTFFFFYKRHKPKNTHTLREDPRIPRATQIMNRLLFLSKQTRHQPTLALPKTRFITLQEGAFKCITLLACNAPRCNQLPKQSSSKAQGRIRNLANKFACKISFHRILF